MIYKIGTQFGRLTLIDKVRNGNKTKWLVRCECGNEKLVQGYDVIKGKTRSCGCLRQENTGEMFRTHGLHGSRTYNIWKGVRHRINNPNCFDYKDYGGRGITICERWDDYENFLSDLGECPPDYSIERIDVNGNYCPENCCWIHKSLQNKNKRNTIR